MIGVGVQCDRHDAACRHIEAMNHHWARGLREPLSHNAVHRGAVVLSWYAEHTSRLVHNSYVVIVIDNVQLVVVVISRFRTVRVYIQPLEHPLQYGLAPALAGWAEGTIMSYDILW